MFQDLILCLCSQILYWNSSSPSFHATQLCLYIYYTSISVLAKTTSDTELVEGHEFQNPSTLSSEQQLKKLSLSKRKAF